MLKITEDNSANTITEYQTSVNKSYNLFLSDEFVLKLDFTQVQLHFCDDFFFFFFFFISVQDLSRLQQRLYLLISYILNTYFHWMTYV